MLARPAALGMNDSLLATDVEALKTDLIVFFVPFFLMHAECCKPPDHRRWLNMEDITILLYKSITETAAL